MIIGSEIFFFIAAVNFLINEENARVKSFGPKILFSVTNSIANKAVNMLEEKDCLEDLFSSLDYKREEKEKDCHHCLNVQFFLFMKYSLG